MISSHILEELGNVATIFGIIEKGRLILELSQAQLKQQCEERVEIVSTDNGRVAITLEGMGIRQYRVISADTVYAYGCMQRVDEISRQLVERDVAIRRIGVAGTSLEDVYAEMVGSGVLLIFAGVFASVYSDEERKSGFLKNLTVGRSGKKYIFASKAPVLLLFCFLQSIL